MKRRFYVAYCVAKLKRKSIFGIKDITVGHGYFRLFYCYEDEVEKKYIKSLKTINNSWHEDGRDWEVESYQRQFEKDKRVHSINDLMNRLPSEDFVNYVLDNVMLY